MNRLTLKNNTKLFDFDFTVFSLVKLYKVVFFKSLFVMRFYKKWGSTRVCFFYKI